MWSYRKKVVLSEIFICIFVDSPAMLKVFWVLDLAIHNPWQLGLRVGRDCEWLQEPHPLVIMNSHSRVWYSLIGKVVVSILQVNMLGSFRFSIGPMNVASDKLEGQSHLPDS